MVARLHHSPWPIDAVAATTAATGYPASNVLTSSVGKPWRSTSTATQNVDIDLGTARTAPVLTLQGPNTAGCSVSYGSGSYTATNAGAQVLALDRHGRRKHSLALAGSVRYIRIVFGGTAPDDGADHFELGAVAVFGSTLTLPENPLLGAEASARYPQTRIELPNGQTFGIDRGVARQRLSLRFRSARTEDIEQLVRIARRGLGWLDLDVASNRELQWPVRHVEDEQARQLSQALQDEAAVILREVA